MTYLSSFIQNLTTIYIVLYIYSTGSGRTGAYIAFDIAMDTFQRHAVVDVLNSIIAIRRYRPALVSETILLDTIYHAFYLHIICGQSHVPISMLQCVLLRSHTARMRTLGVDHEYRVWRFVVVTSVLSPRDMSLIF